MTSSLLKKIQSIPIYIHVLFFIAGMLNFSVPFMVQTNEQYDELIGRFYEVMRELENNESLPTADLINRVNTQYEDTSFNIQLIQESDGVRVKLNGVMLQQVANENSITTQMLLTELLGEVGQLRMVHLVVDLLKGMLYVAFVSLALIVTVQYVSRRAIKFKPAFKYVTIPTVFGSLIVLGMSEVGALSTNGIFVMSFVVTSILFSLFCLKDLKRAMTGDYLGEGRIDYDVY